MIKENKKGRQLNSPILLQVILVVAGKSKQRLKNAGNFSNNKRVCHEKNKVSISLQESLTIFFLPFYLFIYHGCCVWVYDCCFYIDPARLLTNISLSPKRNPSATNKSSIVHPSLGFFDACQEKVAKKSFRHRMDTMFRNIMVSNRY